MIPYLSNEMSPTYPSNKATEIVLTKVQATTTMNVKVSPTATPTTSGDCYIASIFRLDQWTPSDAEIEGAMDAIMQRPNSPEQLRQRVVEATVNDIDGVYSKPMPPIVRR